MRLYRSCSLSVTRLYRLFSTAWSSGPPYRCNRFGGLSLVSPLAPMAKARGARRVFSLHTLPMHMLAGIAPARTLISLGE